MDVSSNPQMDKGEITVWLTREPCFPADIVIWPISERPRYNHDYRGFTLGDSKKWACGFIPVEFINNIPEKLSVGGPDAIVLGTITF